MASAAGQLDAETTHTLLCQSLLHHDLGEAARLLDANGDPNSRSSRLDGPYGGDTPLTLAARIGDLDAVQLLVRAQADVGCPSPRHLTALHEAAAYGRTPVVKMLLACGAPTDGPARHHAPWRSPRALEAETSASSASNEPAGAIVCSVEREGSAVLFDTVDEEEHAARYTPLHAAAEWGKEAVLVVLLEADAYMYHLDESGQTAEDLAIAAQRQRKAQGYDEAAEARARCAQLLQSYRRADQARRRAMQNDHTKCNDSDGGDSRLDGASETDARLRGYAAALRSCPESVRWRSALLAEIAAAATETEHLFSSTANKTRQWAEEDTQQRIQDRAKVLATLAERTQLLQADVRARVQKAAHLAERNESARKWALKSAVQVSHSVLLVPHCLSVFCFFG